MKNTLKTGGRRPVSRPRAVGAAPVAERARLAETTEAMLSGRLGLDDWFDKFEPIEELDYELEEMISLW